ncbi:MAG: CoB--CoM heterodisulfide reductase subunit C [Methanobrevibacter sp.]|jgi:heterodisulfide reductase subunit C|nr:CoB--CoM heterodisulfide reductase subunit C [Methanobrevibacter sp.]
MSLIKYLKSLFKGDNQDVIKNESVKEAPVKIDINSKDKRSSTDEITEENTGSSVTKNSTTPKSKESIKTESKKQKTVEKENSVETGTTKEKNSSIDRPAKKETIKKEEISEVETVKKEKFKVENEKSTLKKDSKDEVAVAVEEKTKVSEEKDKKGDNMTLLEENLVIRPESVNKEFTQLFVDAGIDSVEHCFQCGTCSGGCPSGRRTPYKVRQIVRKCLMGLKDDVISDPALWMCTTCYTCQERCPRSVKIVEIIKLARNEAAKAGFMAPAHRATGSFVIKTGHGVPINDATKVLRKKVGLSELPPTTHSEAKALEDIRTICKATGFDKLIGYNMETNELVE